MPSILLKEKRFVGLSEIEGKKGDAAFAPQKNEALPSHSVLRPIIIPFFHPFWVVFHMFSLAFRVYVCLLVGAFRSTRAGSGNLSLQNEPQMRQDEAQLGAGRYTTWRTGRRGLGEREGDR